MTPGVDRGGSRLGDRYVRPWLLHVVLPRKLGVHEAVVELGLRQRPVVVHVKADEDHAKHLLLPLLVAALRVRVREQRQEGARTLVRDVNLLLLLPFLADAPDLEKVIQRAHRHHGLSSDPGALRDSEIPMP